MAKSISDLYKEYKKKGGKKTFAAFRPTAVAKKNKQNSTPAKKKAVKRTIKKRAAAPSKITNTHRTRARRYST